MKYKLSIVILVVSLLSACANSQSLEEVIQDYRIKSLLHQQEVDDGVVLFYIPNIGGDEHDGVTLEARFIKKMLFGI